MGRGCFPTAESSGTATADEGHGSKTIRVKAHSLRRGDKLVPTRRVVATVDQRPHGIGPGKVRITFTSTREKLFNSRAELSVERPHDVGAG